MLLRLAFSVSLLAWTFPVGVNASHENSGIFHRHQELAKRSEGDLQLFRRVPNARLSWYSGETGNPGSCGPFLTNSDFFVAVNAEQMNSAWCFKTVRITYNGRSTIGTIKDTCPSSSCPWGGLDLSPSLFSYFAPQGIGIINGDWEFTDEPTAEPTPTSTWHPPPPTSTSISKAVSKTLTTSHIVPTSSSSSVSSSSASLNATSATISSAVPSSSSLNVPVGNLDTLNEILIQFEGIITTGSKL